MCRLIAMAILFAAVLMAGFVFLIVKFVPSPWSWVLLVALPIVAAFLAKAAGSMVVKFFMLQFLGFKSGVLKGATAVVHGVSSTAKPNDVKPGDDAEGGETDTDAESGEPDNRKYYIVDVTITPKATSNTPMQFWDIDDLVVVAFDAPAFNPWKSDPGEGDDACVIQNVKVREQGDFVDPEASKFPGEQTLRLTLAQKPDGPKRLKFRYYTEDFGDIMLT